MVIGCIEKLNVTSWQIQIGPLDARVPNGVVIYSYSLSMEHWRELKTAGTVPNDLRPTIFIMQPGSPSPP